LGHLHAHAMVIIENGMSSISALTTLTRCRSAYAVG
jgi:hypothetical protein